MASDLLLCPGFNKTTYLSPIVPVNLVIFDEITFLFVIPMPDIHHLKFIINVKQV